MSSQVTLIRGEAPPTEGRVQVEETGEVCMWHGCSTIQMTRPVEPGSPILKTLPPVCPGCCIHATIQWQEEAKRYYAALLQHGMSGERLSCLLSTVVCDKPQLSAENHLFAAVLTRARLTQTSLRATVGDLLQDSADPGYFSLRESQTGCVRAGPFLTHPMTDCMSE